MPLLHNWSEIDEEGGGGSSVRKRKLEGCGAGMVRLEIAAGTTAERHAHPYEQFVQVLSGRGTLETAEGRHAFVAGSVFHFPADTWHAARFDEDSILVETNLRS